ncbi:MAG: hypothetical protein AAF063_32315 [Cyanobacteria bacterium J06643_5]
MRQFTTFQLLGIQFGVSETTANDLKGRRYRLKRRFYKLHSINTLSVIISFAGI